MKHIFTGLLIACLFSCEKEDNTPKGTVTFWRYEQGSWNLLIDGVDKGPYAQKLIAPPCRSSEYLTLDLTIGIHTYTMKNNDGLDWGEIRYFEVVEGCTVVKTVY